MCVGAEAFFVAANDDAHNLRMHFEFWGVKSNMQNIVCLNLDTYSGFDSLGALCVSTVGAFKRILLWLKPGD